MTLIEEYFKNMIDFLNIRTFIRCKRDEQDIVDTFFTYMIATDTDIMDIAFHFDAMYTNDEEYTKSLLEELKETITTQVAKNKNNYEENLTHYSIPAISSLTDMRTTKEL